MGAENVKAVRVLRRLRLAKAEQDLALLEAAIAEHAQMQTDAEKLINSSASSPLTRNNAKVTFCYCTGMLATYNCVARGLREKIQWLSRD